MKKRELKLEAIIENKIEDLLNEIEYEERRMECCAYDKSDLAYLESLKEELAELEDKLERLCA